LEVKVLQTPTFKNQYKIYDEKTKKSIDEAIQEITKDPTLGKEQKGELESIFVYEFNVGKGEGVLAYSYDKESRQLKFVKIN